MKMEMIKISALVFLAFMCCNAAAKSKKAKKPSRPIKLYYLPPSPPCRSVMMTANVLGLELDMVMTNIMEGEHMTPEFLKMNPQHTIPTMDDEGFILWESRAILSYLVNAYGRGDSLYPKNPKMRGLIDQRLMFDLSTLYPRYLNVYAPVIFHGQNMNDEDVLKLEEALEWLDTMIGYKPYVAGDFMSIADISILVTFTNLEAFGFDLSKWKHVSAWFDRMKTEMEPFGYKAIDQAGAEILASFLKKD